MRISDLPTRLQRVVKMRPLTNEVTSWCWVWQGRKGKGGYARVNYQGRPWYVHILTTLLDGRPKPEGLESDHLCNRRLCINPAHIEFVTHSENILRSIRRGRPLPPHFAARAEATHCINGHEFTPENTVIERSQRGAPNRRCRICKNERERLRKRRVRGGE